MFWLLAAFLGDGVSALKNPSPEAFSGVVVFMVAALVSIIAHELGHALSGLKFGAPRTEIQLHGMGGVAMFPGAQFTTKQRILMTAAGPGVNLALGFIAGVGASFLFGDGPAGTEKGAYLLAFLKVMMGINFFWAVVNLMPVIPLDGGQIVRAFLGDHRIKTTCIISFVTVAILAFGLWMYTKSIYNMLIMAFLASHTMQVWQAASARER